MLGTLLNSAVNMTKYFQETPQRVLTLYTKTTKIISQKKKIAEITFYMTAHRLALMQFDSTFTSKKEPGSLHGSETQIGKLEFLQPVGGSNTFYPRKRAPKNGFLVSKSIYKFKHSIPFVG